MQYVKEIPLGANTEISTQSKNEQYFSGFIASIQILQPLVIKRQLRQVTFTVLDKW